MPARPVEIPALADSDDLTQLAFADHIPYLMLIGIAEPLRPQLHHPIALQRRIPRHLGVFERIGHGLFAIAILTCAHHFRQQPGMLVIACADHHRVQLRVGQQLFRVLKGLGPHSEKLLGIVGGPIAVDRPEIADAAQIEVRVGLRRQLQHLPVAARGNGAAATGSDAGPLLAQKTLTVQEAEKQLVIRALQESNGNRTLAARKIGISRRTLHRKLHTYHLEGF